MDSTLTAHELELILGSNDTIYLTQENIELIEKAMQKVLAENEWRFEILQSNIQPQDQFVI